MGTFLAAKDLLLKYDVTSTKDENGNKSRGTAYEFQDYAYRLASDLNDLEHLKVYMRLAKNYPRRLLERVYESVSDVETDSLGKLFMWKFKQVKDEYEYQVNFSSDFIYKNSKYFKDIFFKNILEKSKEADIANLDINLKCKQSILIVGPSNVAQVQALSKYHNLFGIDISSKLIKNLKTKVSKTNSRKIICKDFFKNTYKENYFDFIYVDTYWKQIGLSEEKKFIENIVSILKKASVCIIKMNLDLEDSQEWKFIEYKGEKVHYLSKRNGIDTINKKFKEAGLLIKKLNEKEGVIIVKKT